MTQTITINLTKEKPEEIGTKKSNIQVSLKGTKLQITGIPDGHILEYVARDARKKSTYFIVHVPEKEWDYKDFRLHIGAVNELIEAKVDTVYRKRDGGTTDITYILEGHQGKLNFPTPLNKATSPTNDYMGKLTTLEKLL